MDPIAARRTQAGACVVHGIHAVLWALDALVADGAIAEPITALRVDFRRFIYVESLVAARLVRRTKSSLRAELSSDGVVTTTLDVSFAPARAKARPLLSTAEVPARTAPRSLEPDELRQCAGWLPTLADQPAAQMFAHAAGTLGADRVAAIANLSTLVGMVCPGLHSLFHGFDIEVVPESRDTGGLSFTVRGFDERFQMLELEVAGSGLVGTVTAFVRHAPVAQPRLADIMDSVARDEFSTTTALIIGGSRGLGALTARAIAAGGGRVVITYSVGPDDASEVARELGETTCRVLRYDAREDARSQLEQLEWKVNQLYYFATPQIFRQKAQLYAPARFAEFCQIYVDGFAKLCVALRLTKQEQLTIFYPSSISVDAPPRELLEYSMAKAAAEILCAEFNRAQGFRVLVRRLPRVPTDQTVTVMPVESRPALEVMLPIIREMHATDDRLT